MKNSIGVVILAAGQGTRLHLDLPKALAPLAGFKIVDYPIMESQKFIKSSGLLGEITLVLGHRKEEVESYLRSTHQNLNFVIQEKQLGTADAVNAYFSQNKNASIHEYTIILCADTPLIRESDLQKLFEVMKTKNLEAVAASFIAPNPHGYGRILRNQKGNLGFSIVEEKDASDSIRNITEVNSGFYVAKTDFLIGHLKNIKSDNKAREFYLTDIFKDNYRVLPLLFNDGFKFLGVNTLRDLEVVHGHLRQEINGSLSSSGVRFIDSACTYIDQTVQVKKGTTIYPNVIIEGKTTIGENAIISAGSVIKNCQIANGVKIKPYSVLEDSIIESEAAIGPFAHLRPGANIGSEAKVGNFVEIKKSKLEHGTKVSHLSYVGDAEIGENSNIGCGFITCNYDGVNKHVTKIGKNCFIGSDSQTVAPVEIGDNCFVASGSTITSPMKDGAFAISRGKQITKDGMASRFLKGKK
ncbi:MAG: UDP-N-acetylglucosamine diphosphorylase/glucosamine-1-phosphate N-acetyltransferase [Bdellovibrionales bacterium RIFOXYD12_FULL_39_22]|nr:MAG: UDP-N-acetylglucosamine diphosphorylase/glucosamine-1-phosphate N-acetyltransferase [Bdellovibrionales bacterium RIFOXYB1_FULL_39_21]OFZ40402.1 MAG: UDP-N-acetylglucosamine diphosphorylase/glucosamine-1-phosphate N-acetyltransferase [Bdellovibrionales bacterium RIFOXYC12_FULL_39_17]OFZ49651.1 MAG: UDP-N-acetylglucosamine diphosphorylase/glucosamine-1-phosphate N-acetyltransferase [Bdellovibrionales bacterium RIFOXYC1_FULL_39_130]OFZ77321.1 MAG: UDP-N-acetylglucosamine diphosphorylase/glu